MSKVTIRKKGDFSKTMKFMNGLVQRKYLKILDKYGRAGVEALRAATPKDTGVTADSWVYDIVSDNISTTISWRNTNESANKTGYKFNIAILIQYGHATRNGGWVEGFDYVNPAMKPIFEEIAKSAVEAMYII